MVLVEPVAFVLAVVFGLPVVFVLAVVFGAAAGLCVALFPCVAAPAAGAVVFTFGAPLPCAAAPLAEPISTTAHAIETIALMGTSAKARVAQPGRARSGSPEQRLCPSSAGER